ncbi:hypothetical protein [Mesorhizobium sp. LjNodule214]|uniref:hypothetical protein n=1 Tax=Mesorhizobium sp. LjNodule214 TaxID=3342252 RepID=UPI003ECF917C
MCGADSLKSAAKIVQNPLGLDSLDAYDLLLRVLPDVHTFTTQAPVLDAEKVQLGVVTHGYASHGALVEFRGQTAHTGPTPMDKRHNALLAAARLL